MTFREVSAADLQGRIRHALRIAGPLSASSLAHRIADRDEYPITHEQLYGALVHLEAEGQVAIGGGYRPHWRIASPIES